LTNQLSFTFLPLATIISRFLRLNNERSDK
jgi:hypothetical protein